MKIIDTQTVYETLSKAIEEMKHIARNNEDNAKIVDDIKNISEIRLKWIPNNWE